MRAQEGSPSFQNISATTGTFVLQGGAYVIDAIATWNSGSITLQRLGPDGNTFLTAATALTADTSAPSAICLPPGTYRFLVTTATAAFLSISRIPGE